MVAYFSTLTPLIDWCEKEHPGHNGERCAMAYLHHYQTFDDTGSFYGDFTDPEIAQNLPVNVLDNISKGMLGIAVGIYLMGIEIGQSEL